MNIDRAWALTRIFFQSHVFNWPWRSRDHRRDVRTDVLSRVAPEYFKRYLPAVKNVVDGPVIKDDKNEKIFSYAVSLHPYDRSTGSPCYGR